MLSGLLLHGYEEQRCVDAQQESESGDSEAEEAVCQESPHAMMAQWKKKKKKKRIIPFENHNAICVMTGFNRSRWHGSLEL